ncbi:tetratricopeptide repeat protein [Candidatus Zixiibacteriota bacterium]
MTSGNSSISRQTSLLLLIIILLTPLSIVGQENLVEQARTAHEEGRDEEALRLIRRATRKDKEDVRAWMLQGEIYLSLVDRGLTERRAKNAIDAFDRVIQLNPSYPDVYLKKGIAWLEGVGDSLMAGIEFENQLQADPLHMDATIRLLELSVDMREWEMAESLASRVLVEFRNQPRIYRPLIKLYLKKREWSSAALVTRRYMAILSPVEREVIDDITPLLNSAEEALYRELDAEARDLYRRRYWARRGGASLDGYATRFIEHVWRVAEARTRFGDTIYPWDFRGELFVRYGPPDFRVTSTSGLSLNMILDGDFQSQWRSRMLELGLPVNSFDSGNSTTFFNSDFEPPRGVGRFSFWVYKWDGFLFVLRDVTVGGEMQLTGDGLALNNALKEQLPVISRLEEINEELRPVFQVAQFRGADGKTRLHTYFSIPVSELIGTTLDSLPSEAMISEVTLVDENVRIIADVNRSRVIQAGPSTEIQRSRRFMEALTLDINPGTYQISSFVAHRSSQRFGSIGPVTIDIRDYSGIDLAMSDLVLASADTLGDLEKNLLDEGLVFLPHPAGVFDIDRSFQVYFELYGLGRDIDGITDYEVMYEVFPEPGTQARSGFIQSSIEALLGIGRGEPVVTLSSTYRSLKPDNIHRPLLSLSEYPEGPYRLRVTVKDNILDREVSREVTLLALHPFPPDRN